MNRRQFLLSSGLGVVPIAGYIGGGRSRSDVDYDHPPSDDTAIPIRVENAKSREYEFSISVVSSEEEAVFSRDVSVEGSSHQTIGEFGKVGETYTVEVTVEDYQQPITVENLDGTKEMTLIKDFQSTSTVTLSDSASSLVILLSEEGRLVVAVFI